MMNKRLLNGSITRRDLLLSLSMTPMVSWGNFLSQPMDNTNPEALLIWLAQMTDKSSGLLYYMDSGTAHFLSPLATAKTAIWAAKTGHYNILRQCADGLKNAQMVLAQRDNTLTGALASSYTQEQTLKSGDYMYACEQLVAIYAWLEAAKILQKEDYLNCAIACGDFFKRNFLNGYALGAWSKPYPVPFNYMLVNKAYENTMRNGLEFLWIISLEKLYQATAKPLWHMLYEDALAFYLTSQAKNGLWYDTFSPVKNKWFWYTPESVVADNMLRCAIAARLHQQEHQVNVFLQQFLAKNSTFVWGYLSTQDSGSGFIARDKPYYDVVATALLRSLYHLGKEELLSAYCQKQLLSLDNQGSAGYFWGRYSNNLAPIAQERAVITTLWAHENIYPQI